MGIGPAEQRRGGILRGRVAQERRRGLSENQPFWKTCAPETFRNRQLESGIQQIEEATERRPDAIALDLPSRRSRLTTAGRPLQCGVCRCNNLLLRNRRSKCLARLHRRNDCIQQRHIENTVPFVVHYPQIPCQPHDHLRGQGPEAGAQRAASVKSHQQFVQSRRRSALDQRPQRFSLRFQRLEAPRAVGMPSRARLDVGGAPGDLVVEHRHLGIAGGGLASRRRPAGHVVGQLCGESFDLTLVFQRPFQQAKRQVELPDQHHPARSFLLEELVAPLQDPRGDLLGDGSERVHASGGRANGQRQRPDPALHLNRRSRARDRLRRPRCAPRATRAGPR